MPTYTYKARDNSGKPVKGILDADDEQDLSNRIKKIGYFLTSAKPIIVLGKRSEQKLKHKGHLSSQELLNITTQIAISLDSGVTLLTSLNDMAESTEQRTIKAIIEDIARRVESGTSLKDALLEHPRSFSMLYCSIIGAGEGTGKLPYVLNDLARLLEWQLELKARITEASIYPAILFVVMIAVVCVLVGVVIPKFEPMFADMGATLPLPTKVMLEASKVFRKFWWMMALLVAGGIAGLKVAMTKEKGRRKIDMWKLKLPIMGDLMNKVALSRFCHTFALALRSGVNVFSALGIASEVTGNKHLEASVVKARDYVNVGEKISTALQMSGKFPHLVIRMIAVGEQTGTLSDTLEKVNQYYDKEIPSTIKRIFALMEPMMIIVMGVVVSGIALSVFLPLTQMISKVGD
jgi:type II secretory pathway component PulF